jgi:hypothetical protein
MARKVNMRHSVRSVCFSNNPSARKKGGSLVGNEHSKATTTLPGKVERVINAQPDSGEPEKAQIAVEGADHLYREIRVPNHLVDEKGQEVKLKKGAEVDVTIEADPAETDRVPASESSR